ncbi:hypothetical protein PR003_g20350 [Phytophthora rubi]|uniref:Uncharacterized protein n=1 Tax=Phytophthora rubi TaxID=129364 RepID=A0A6A4DXE8_9STRA|nr:hypothetical protein PR003_g20350 [Phytophthora rubi]
MTMFELCLASAIALAKQSPNLYNNLVSISLYVSLDIIKVLQTNRVTAYVSLDIIKVLQTNRVTSDANMAYEGTHAVARTSELDEELGTSSATTRARTHAT